MMLMSLLKLKPVWFDTGENERHAVKGCFFRLRIGCKSGESFPASNLTFYINDEIANDKNVRKGRSHFADNRGEFFPV